MKLTRPANLSPKSRVRTIFLPSSSHTKINPTRTEPSADDYDDNDDNNLLKLDRNENYLRKLGRSLADMIRKVNRNEIARRESSTTKLRKHTESDGNEPKTVNSNNFFRNSTVMDSGKRNKRRNDKFLHRRPTNPEDYELFMSLKDNQPASSGIDYYDCWTVGWGKWMERGDLSEVLLKIDVPIHDMKR